MSELRERVLRDLALRKLTPVKYKYSVHRSKARVYRYLIIISILLVDAE